MLLYHYRHAQLPRQWPCSPHVTTSKVLPNIGFLLREDAVYLLQQHTFWADLPADLTLFALIEDATCRGLSVQHPQVQWVDDITWVNLCLNSEGIIAWPA